jgi:hypothetical protein
MPRNQLPVPDSKQLVENDAFDGHDADTLRGRKHNVHPPRRYRGSASRIRRLRWAAHTPAGVWILFSLVLTATFLLLACLARLS